jgi:hypothetical protein
MNNPPLDNSSSHDRWTYIKLNRARIENKNINTGGTIENTSVTTNVIDTCIPILDSVIYSSIDTLEGVEKLIVELCDLEFPSDKFKNPCDIDGFESLLAIILDNLVDVLERKGGPVSLKSLPTGQYFSRGNFVWKTILPNNNPRARFEYRKNNEQYLISKEKQKLEEEAEMLEKQQYNTTEACKNLLFKTYPSLDKDGWKRLRKYKLVYCEKDNRGYDEYYVIVRIFKNQDIRATVIFDPFMFIANSEDEDEGTEKQNCPLYVSHAKEPRSSNSDIKFPICYGKDLSGRVIFGGFGAYYDDEDESIAFVCAPEFSNPERNYSDGTEDAYVKTTLEKLFPNRGLDKICEEYWELNKLGNESREDLKKLIIEKLTAAGAFFEIEDTE